MNQSFITNPALKGLSMGSKEWFDAQKTLIKEKPLIKRCYDLWYRKLMEDSESVPDRFRKMIVLELGSGSSYIKELMPEVITSDVAPGIADMVIDGRSLSFPDASIKAIFLTHVLHHIPDISLFMKEAGRVLVPGGVISIVDCTHTPLARCFFSKIHPEPYDDAAEQWSFPEGNSMLDSNQALSWILFFRDREKFTKQFPFIHIEKISYLPWFSYLMSGGVNLRSLVPGCLVPVFPSLDRILSPLDGIFAIHWHITLRINDESFNGDA